MYIISLPAMEWLIEWNQNIHLPAQLHELEKLFRTWEEDNTAVTDMLLNARGLWAVVGGVLVIGVITGFSEELFFRGGLQGIISRTKIGNMQAIWIAAFIFSTMHFQFFGFIPRFLMGAFFGYLLVWTGDIKVSAFAHILNNSIVVVTAALSESLTASEPETGLMPDVPFLPLISVILTAIFLYYFRGFFFKEHHKQTYPWQKSQLPPVTEK